MDNLINLIKLTDDELSAIMTALENTLLSTKKYIDEGNNLDEATQGAIGEIKAIYDKLKEEYYF